MAKATTGPVRVGDTGTAVTRLYPAGHVLVNGVKYPARSRYGPVDRDAPIAIIGGDHSGLLVDQVREDCDTHELPNHGQAVFASVGARLAHEGAKSDAQRREWQAQRRVQGQRTGATLGAGFGFLVVGALAGVPIHDVGMGVRVVLACVAIVAGTVWGVVVYRFLDAQLQRLSFGLHRFTFFSTSLTLVGGAGGCILGGRWLGLQGAASFGILGTGLSGMILVAFSILALSAEGASEAIDLDATGAELNLDHPDAFGAASRNDNGR